MVLVLETSAILCIWHHRLKTTCMAVLETTGMHSLVLETSAMLYIWHHRLRTTWMVVVLETTGMHSLVLETSAMLCIWHHRLRTTCMAVLLETTGMHSLVLETSAMLAVHLASQAENYFMVVVLETTGIFILCRLHRLCSTCTWAHTTWVHTASNPWLTAALHRHRNHFKVKHIVPTSI